MRRNNVNFNNDRLVLRNKKKKNNITYYLLNIKIINNKNGPYIICLIKRLYMLTSEVYYNLPNIIFVHENVSNNLSIQIKYYILKLKLFFYCYCKSAITRLHYTYYPKNHFFFFFYNFMANDNCNNSYKF